MARDFNGTTSYLHLGVTLASAYPFSVAAWIKPDSVGDEASIFALGDSSSSTNNLDCAINPTTGGNYQVLATAYNGTNASQVFDSADLTYGVWQHAGWEFGSATSRKTYANGTSGGSSTTPSVTYPSGIDAARIGRRVITSAFQAYYDGVVGEVVATKSVLTADQWTALALGVDPRFVIDKADIIDFWTLHRELGGVKGNVFSDTSTSIVPASARTFFIPRPVHVQTSSAQNFTLVAGVGGFSLAGQTVGIRANRTLGASAGSYSEAGQTVGLIEDRVLPAASGSYAFTGQAVGLLYGRNLAAAVGSYSFNGQDVTLTYSGAGSPVLVADAGVFSVSGQAVGLLANRTLAASAGSYTETGQTVGLLADRKITAGLGVYSFSGTPILFRADRKLTAGAGTYTFTGVDVTLTVGSLVLYIQDLDEATPIGVSGVESAGDDEIRTIKSAIANTFPNIAGVVTATQDEINGAVFWGSGTKMVFYQAAAPTGWTQDVSAGLNDSALRLVSGATGGSTAGTNSVFTGVANTDSHALTVPQMASHGHTYSGQHSFSLVTTSGVGVASQLWISSTNASTGSAGSGSGHVHSISFAPKYLDVIICSKD